MSSSAEIKILVQHIVKLLKEEPDRWESRCDSLEYTPEGLFSRTICILDASSFWNHSLRVYDENHRTLTLRTHILHRCEVAGAINKWCKYQTAKVDAVHDEFIRRATNRTAK